MKSAWKNQKGQTAIEYILLLLVMVSIITSLLAYIKNKYLGNADQCNTTASKATLLCKINGYISPKSEGIPFQYYPFKK
jgi:Flp pilus assembly pilin Flp